MSGAEAIPGNKMGGSRNHNEWSRGGSKAIKMKGSRGGFKAIKMRGAEAVPGDQNEGSRGGSRQ